MKRAVGFFIMLTMTYAAGNAQYFVEGSLGAGYRKDTPMINTFAPNVYFNVSPLVGYRLNDKMAVGTKASLFRRKEKRMIIDQDTGDKIKSELINTEWSLSVFSRNKLWGSKRISLHLESSLYKSSNGYVVKQGLIVTSKQIDSSFGINILPLVTCEISERISLIASCEILSFDLSYRVSTYEPSGYVSKHHHFGFAGQSTIFDYLHSVRIGFIYHFKKSVK